MSIKCYKFGLLEPISGFDQEAIDVLFKRNKLWNDLVALEHNFRLKYRDFVLKSDEELQLIQSEIDSLSASIEELITAKKKLRQKERTAKVDDKFINETIRANKEKRKKLSEIAKEIRARVKIEIAPRIAELNSQHYENIKQVRKESGLWWGNYETVMEAYDAARVKAMKSNSELRFKRFDGTGKFAVRFQDGGLSFDDLMNGKSNDLIVEKLDISHLQNLSSRGIRSRARHHLKISIFTYQDENGKKQRHYVTLPLVMHRDMEEGKIKFIHVQRNRVGNQFNWSCSITMQTDDEPANISNHPSSKSCGIDIGFRLVKDGLRVATLADSQDHTEHLILPNTWIERMNYVETLQSELSEEMNLMWVVLKKQLSVMIEHPEHLKEIIGNMLKMGEKLPYGGIKKLFNALKADEDLMPECLAILRAWDKKIYRREREMFNLKNKLLSQRKHIYRNFAHMISNAYAHVIIEDMNLKEMVKVEKSETQSNDMAAPIRANRQRASLYELINAIKLACVKTGSMFEKVEAAYSTRNCNFCGHVNARTDNINMICAGCGSMYDTDINAAKNFLKGDYLQEKQIVSA